MEPKPCPYCKSAEVFYGEYDTLSETTFGGYKIRCKFFTMTGAANTAPRLATGATAGASALIRAMTYK